MKAISAFRSACGALVALASIYAWSQGGETSVESNGAAMTAPGTATAKATRQANRALRGKVYAAIVKHKEIDAGNISVIAKDGAVTLGGTVADAVQTDKVEEISKGVPGVMSVTNRLIVKKPFGGQ